MNSSKIGTILLEILPVSDFTGFVSVSLPQITLQETDMEHRANLTALWSCMGEGTVNAGYVSRIDCVQQQRCTQWKGTVEGMLAMPYKRV